MGPKEGGAGEAPTSYGSPDPYKVLRLKKGATRDEIRAAYRREVAQYHPDKVAQLGPELQELATEKTKQLNEAYRVLSDVP
jgi:curved DNA-binding protein CbpA